MRMHFINGSRRHSANIDKLSLINIALSNQNYKQKNL